MKKIAIIGALLLAIAATLPFFGNSLVKSHIDDRVKQLQSFGLDVQNEKTQSSYLQTSKHFEFVLQDSQKFLDYLSQYADKQIPAYVNATLDGVVIGADVSYSNIPFTKAVEVDIYPLALSPKMRESLKQDDPEFEKYFSAFLGSKGLEYHINYNLVSQDFDGYIKDIKEKFTFQTKANISFVLSGVTFDGNGELIAPKEMHSRIDTINMQIEHNNEKVLFALSDVASSSNFDSPLTYVSSLSVGGFDMEVNADNAPSFLHLKKLYANISSNDQDKDGEVNAKFTLKHFDFKAKDQTLASNNLAYDIAVDGLDKKVMDDIRIIAKKMQNDQNPLLVGEMQKALIALFSHGMKINIAQLEAHDIVHNNGDNLGAFKLTMDTTVKSDQDLAHKMQTSPMLLMQNIATKWHISLDKKLYDALNKNPNMAAQLDKYRKENGDAVVFDIVFEDTQLTVNGQTIQ